MEENFIPPQPVQPEKKQKNLFKIAFFVLVGLFIFSAATGAAYLLKIKSSQSPTNPAQNNQTQNNENPEVKSDIVWIPPQQVAGFGLFKAGSEGYHHEDISKYYKVGDVKNGKYSGGQIFTIFASIEGPSFYPDDYRVIKKDNQIILLKKYSAELTQYDNIDRQKIVIDSDYQIKELELPEKISGPSPRQILTLEQNINEFFSLNEITKVFTDASVGDVYTSEAAYYNYTNPDLFQKNGFYVKASDGTVRVYSYKPDFLSDKNIPQITWSDGQKNTTDYSFTDRTGCGSTNYISVYSKDAGYLVNFEKIGTNSKNESIYGLKDLNDYLLKDFYDKNYNPYPPETKLSYAEFLKKHPMFFWADPFGRMIKFENMDFVPLAECGKPVIYLYPEKETKITVKLTPKGGFSYSEPEYGNGWNVIADPLSNIEDLNSGKIFPYLFWEGTGGIYDSPKKGFIVKKENVYSFLSEKLSYIGLNKKEIADFIEFWGPKMNSAPYYFVSFLGNREMNYIAPLEITPKPDTIIRVLMDFSPLQQPISVNAYSLPHFERNGFTVVEWGGVIK